MNVILFLMSLDELMGANATQFAKLKEACAFFEMDEEDERKRPTNAAIVEQMMEASVATNFAIPQVASLEQIFMHDHPH